jgi:hypothetical protein
MEASLILPVEDLSVWLKAVIDVASSSSSSSSTSSRYKSHDEEEEEGIKSNREKMNIVKALMVGGSDKSQMGGSWELSLEAKERLEWLASVFDEAKGDVKRWRGGNSKKRQGRFEQKRRQQHQQQQQQHQQDQQENQEVILLPSSLTTSTSSVTDLIQLDEAVVKALVTWSQTHQAKSGLETPPRLSSEDMLIHSFCQKACNTHIKYDNGSNQDEEEDVKSGPKKVAGGSGGASDGKKGPTLSLLAHLPYVPSGGEKQDSSSSSNTSNKKRATVITDNKFKDSDEGDDDAAVLNAGTFLEIEVEVVGARLVKWNDSSADGVTSSATVGASEETPVDGK